MRGPSRMLVSSDSWDDPLLRRAGAGGPRLRGTRAVAEFLAGHPAIGKVHCPGLAATHPQHALAARQQAGFGGMVSFELADGRRERVNDVLKTLRWFTLAESLGGVESLGAHPASMTHASMTPEARRRDGITDGSSGCRSGSRTPPT